MSQKNGVATLYELQKKYGCVVVSWYDEVSRLMIFRATVNIGPGYNVQVVIPEDEILDLPVGTLLEEKVIQYFDTNLSKYFDVGPVRLKQWISDTEPVDVRRIFDELVAGNTVVAIRNGGQNNE